MLTIIRSSMFNLIRMHIMLTVIMIMHHHRHHHHHASLHHAAIIAHDHDHASSTTHRINYHDSTSTCINNHHDHALFRLTIHCDHQQPSGRVNQPILVYLFITPSEGTEKRAQTIYWTKVAFQENTVVFDKIEDSAEVDASASWAQLVELAKTRERG